MKNLIINILFIFLSLNTIAQVQWGVNTGVGFNNEFLFNKNIEGRIININELQPAISFQIGANTYLPITKKIEIATELNFFDKAVNFNKNRLDKFYLENPIYLSFNFLKIIKIDMGVSNNILVSKKYFPNKLYTTSFITGLSILLTNDIEMKLQINQELISHINDENFGQKQYFNSAMFKFYYYF